MRKKVVDVMTLHLGVTINMAVHITLPNVQGRGLIREDRFYG